MTSERYLKLKYTSQIHINCTITLTPYGTQVDVDRAIEIYYVGMEYINNNKIEYKAFFQTLLTSKIKVEYCGSNYTKIYFYNDIGNCIRTLKYVTGFYLRIGCKTKEYHPIY